MTKKTGLTIVALILTLIGCRPAATPTVQERPPTATPVVKEVAPTATPVVKEVAPTPTVEEATPTPTAMEEVPTATAAAATPTAIPETPTPGIPAAAVVNGQIVPLAEYQKQVAQATAFFIGQGLDPSSEEGQETLAQVHRQILDQLIDQALIEQAAAREGITVSDEEVEASVQAIKEEMGEEKFNESLVTAGLTYEDFVETQRAQLIGNAVIAWVTASLPTTAEQVHARHILVETRAEAEQVLAQLQAGQDFAALAKEFSLDETTKEQGGDLGWFPRGIMPSALEEVAFALAPGQTSDVVETPFGFHILQVLEKDAAREIPTEMQESLRQQAFMDWLEEQRDQATIERLVGE
ncbi:MAG: peptidylprolyl isomerase [Anaerolineae bacterium]